MSSRPWPSRIVERRREGEQRNARWAALSTAQKIHELDQRLGVGVGAKRQRAKLSGATS